MVKPGIRPKALVIDRVVEIVGEGDRERMVVEPTNSDALATITERAAVQNLTLRAVGTGVSCDAVWVKSGPAVVERCDLISSIDSLVHVTDQIGDRITKKCMVRDISGMRVVLPRSLSRVVGRLRCRFHRNVWNRGLGGR